MTLLPWVLFAAWILQLPPIAKIQPVDDGRQDQSFVAFRTGVIEAAQRGDVQRVLEGMDPKVVATFSGKKGIPALRKEWEIVQSPKAFLREVQEVLSLGGRFSSPSKFVGPYTFTEFPDVPSAQMGDFAVVTSKDAPVFAKSDTNAPAIARLSYDVVRYGTDRVGWYIVTLPDGRRGYVQQNVLRSPTDTQFTIEKKNGRWRITAFFAGYD